MEDPVNLLREWRKAGKSVPLEDGQIVFDGQKFARNTETGFKARKGHTYTLDAVWFLLKHAELKHTDYVNLCGTEGFPVISIVDKKDILNSLNESSSSGQKREASSMNKNSDTSKKDTPLGGLNLSNLREKALAKKKQRTETTQPQSNNSSQQSSQQNHHHHHHQVPEPELVGGPLGEVVNKERQLTNRNTILLSKKEFTSILDMVNTVKHNDDKKRIEKSRLPERSNASDNKELDRRKYSNNHTDTQIIIVPAALTALLTMYNVKEFLEDGIFVPSMDKKNSGAIKESNITIERKKRDDKSHTPVKYHVIDNVSKLSPKDWDRVAACFVLDNTWQFKNWKWTVPRDIFSHVKGYYLLYEEEKVPDNIKEWNVSHLRLSKQKQKQHMSHSAQVNFWEQLDRFRK